MFDDILNAANLYTTGVNEVQQRRDGWLKKYVEVKDHLTAIAAYLNQSATYKQGFFVDVLHAFNEEISGTSAAMPSLVFRSGSMPMLVTFRNAMGEKKSYEEEGFHISFNPTITGQVVVLLTPHRGELDKSPAQYTTLAIIGEPGMLTSGVIDQIIAKGIESAFYTSFTGITRAQQLQQHKDDDDGTPHAPIAHNPIGFKLHDTTEKIK